MRLAASAGAEGHRDAGGTSEAPAARVVPVWLFWTLGLGLLLPVWTGAHFPSEDGLAHLAWTEVYRALADAGTPWQGFYERSVHWNTPNLAYFAMQYGLGSVLEPHLAQRVIVSTLIVSWVAAAAVLSKAMTGTLTLGALASLVLIHSSWLYGGYLSFLVGVPLVLVALALIARNSEGPEPARPRAWLALSWVGVASYYSHLADAAIFLLLIGVAVLAHRREPARLRRLLAAALPTILLVTSYLAASTLGTGGMRWEPLTKTVARFAGFAFFRGLAAPGPGFWVALSLLALVVLVLCIDAARVVLRRLVPRAQGVALVLAACLAILYLIAPDGVGDGYNLKGRFQLLLWATLLPAIPSYLPRRAGAAVFAAICLLLSWQIVTFYLRASRFNTAYDTVVARAVTIPPGSTIERVLEYDHAGFEGSFIRVLAHAPEDLAYHCQCVLLDGYHPSTAFYWVAERDGDSEPARYRVQVQQLPQSSVTIAIAEVGDDPAGISAGHAVKAAAEPDRAEAQPVGGHP